MFLLDTNVISELPKSSDGRADASVTAWLSSVDATMLYLSAITLMELEMGVLRIERRDAHRGTMLRAWLTQRVLPEFANRILPVDAAVAFRCAALHVPDPRSERDALLAATALAHSMTVVTRNVSDFEATGVPLINPWEPR